MMFPCQVETEGHLEFARETNARLFDREGVEVREVVPQGEVPVLQQGPNRLTFRSEDGDEFSPRVEVNLIRLGQKSESGR